MGYGNSSDKLKYFSISSGRFRYKDGGEEHFCDSVWGILVDIYRKWDKGNASLQIKSGWHICLVFADMVESDTGEQPERLVATGSLNSTYGWILGSHIANMEIGKRYRVRVWGGSENNKVTCCLVDYSPDGNNWVPVQRDTFDRVRKFEMAEAAFLSHPAFRTQEDGDPEEEGVDQTKAERPATGEDEFDPFADERGVWNAFGKSFDPATMALAKNPDRGEPLLTQPSVLKVFNDKMDSAGIKQAEQIIAVRSLLRGAGRPADNVVNFDTISAFDAACSAVLIGLIMNDENGAAGRFKTAMSKERAYMKDQLTRATAVEAPKAESAAAASGF